jgi:hypothetical protein
MVTHYPDVIRDLVDQLLTSSMMLRQEVDHQHVNAVLGCAFALHKLIHEPRAKTTEQK